MNVAPFIIIFLSTILIFIRHSIRPSVLQTANRMPLIPLVVITNLEKLAGGTAQPIKVSITSVCSAVRGSGSPKSGIAPEIHVLATCGVCVKPGLVVCFLNVPHGTFGAVILPAGYGITPSIGSTQPLTPLFDAVRETKATSILLLSVILL